MFGILVILSLSLSLSSPSVHPPSSYLTSLSYTIFKNMANVGSFSHFVFVFVFACGFVIVVTGASVDNTCHELSEYVWSCGSVKHGK